MNAVITSVWVTCSPGRDCPADSTATELESFAEPAVEPNTDVAEPEMTVAEPVAELAHTGGGDLVLIVAAALLLVAGSILAALERSFRRV